MYGSQKHFFCVCEFLKLLHKAILHWCIIIKRSIVLWTFTIFLIIIAHYIHLMLWHCDLIHILRFHMSLFKVMYCSPVFSGINDFISLLLYTVLYSTRCTDCLSLYTYFKPMSKWHYYLVFSDWAAQNFSAHIYTHKLEYSLKMFLCDVKKNWGKILNAV